MKKRYFYYFDLVVVEEGGRYGVEDENGRELLPMEYDSISLGCLEKNAMGLVLCRNGRFGYVAFAPEKDPEDEEERTDIKVNRCAVAWLPCLYTRIDVKRNGLVLYRVSETGEKESWFDIHTHTVHEDLHWMQNYVDFDSFWIDGLSPCVIRLKRAGEDAWVDVPPEYGAEPWQTIPLDLSCARCVLCSAESVCADGEEDEDVIGGYDYFFLLLYRNGWRMTPTRSTLSELYAELPSLTKEILAQKTAAQENKTRASGLTLWPYCTQKELMG